MPAPYPQPAASTRCCRSSRWLAARPRGSRQARRRPPSRSADCRRNDRVLGPGRSIGTDGTVRARRNRPRQPRRPPRTWPHRERSTRVAMAHVTSRGAYERLTERLNRFPQGAPPSELLYRILELLFSEREAGLVAQLPIRPVTARRVARIWGMREAEARAVLDGPCLGLAHAPDPRDPARGNRSDRQLRHETGLALAEQELQDPVEQLGRRRALREAVQPLGQPLVCAP